MLNLSERWQKTYPQAHVGLLALKSAVVSEDLSAFNQAKKDLESDLRRRYAGYDREQLKAHPLLAAYDAYYSEFRKTYHVLLQLETVIFKDQPISAPSPLVEAMFMAELENLLLTAGHDRDFVKGPLLADVAAGDEVYQRLGGHLQQTKPRDMMIKDGKGILSTVIYGPDHRTRIRPGTENLIFTVYAPRGIDRECVQKHLTDIGRYVSLIAPHVARERLQVYPVGKT
jgi:DNA/RNA-binding domain of Phe-tRNA-synthetase-like protein